MAPGTDRGSLRSTPEADKESMRNASEADKGACRVHLRRIRRDRRKQKTIYGRRDRDPAKIELSLRHNEYERQDMAKKVLVVDDEKLIVKGIRRSEERRVGKECM